MNVGYEKNINSKTINPFQKNVLEMISSALSENKLVDISLDTAFSSAGLDSMIFIKIVVALETEFEFEFDDEKLLITEFPTVRSMVEYVEFKIQPSQTVNMINFTI